MIFFQSFFLQDREQKQHFFFFGFFTFFLSGALPSGCVIKKTYLCFCLHTADFAPFCEARRVVKLMQLPKVATTIRPTATMLTYLATTTTTTTTTRKWVNIPITSPTMMQPLSILPAVNKNFFHTHTHTQR